MDIITNLKKIRMPESLQNYVEIHRNPQSTDDFWSEDYDVTQEWPKDVDGAGLIVYVYQSLRTWVKTSVSKTPFAFLKKSLDAQPDTLTDVFVIKGTPEYPLTEAEMKALSGLLTNRLKDTETTIFTSYTTVPSMSDRTTKFLTDALNEITSLFVDAGLNVTPQQTTEEEKEQLRTTTETYEHNGVKTTVSVKLKNDNDPTEGVSYVYVRVTDTENNTLITANTGKYPE